MSTRSCAVCVIFLVQFNNSDWFQILRSYIRVLTLAAHSYVLLMYIHIHINACIYTHVNTWHFYAAHMRVSRSHFSRSFVLSTWTVTHDWIMCFVVASILGLINSSSCIDLLLFLPLPPPPPLLLSYFSFHICSDTGHRSVMRTSYFTLAARLFLTYSRHVFVWLCSEMTEEWKCRCLTHRFTVIRRERR